MSFLKFIRSLVKPQSKAVLFPPDLIARIMRQQVYIAMVALFIGTASMYIYTFDPDSEIIPPLSGFSAGLMIGVGLMYRRDLERMRDFADYLQKDHRMLTNDALQRQKIGASVKRGTVYILQDIDVTGWCKIGKTTAPADRIGHFDTMLPFQIRVVHLIASKDCDALESILHRQFASKRKRGEWFELTAADIAWIMQMETV